MSNQRDYRDYTIIELLIALALWGGGVALGVFADHALWHFIAKFW